MVSATATVRLLRRRCSIAFRPEGVPPAAACQRPPRIRGWPGPMPDKPPSGGAPSPAVARLLLVAVVILWGANWPVMKLGVQSMPPLWFATARMVLGAACLLALLAVIGRLKLPTRRDLPVVLTVGARSEERRVGKECVSTCRSRRLR